MSHFSLNYSFDLFHTGYMRSGVSPPFSDIYVFMVSFRFHVPPVTYDTGLLFNNNVIQLLSLDYYHEIDIKWNRRIAESLSRGNGWRMVCERKAKREAKEQKRAVNSNYTKWLSLPAWNWYHARRLREKQAAFYRFLINKLPLSCVLIFL